MAPPTAKRTTTSPGPRSRKGARTRERLVAAAKEVFEEDGFLEARISDIARRAGVAHGSFYYYFDSKEEVFREVAAAVDEHLSAPLTDVVLAPSSMPAAERLREAIRRHFESYQQEARILGVIEEVSRYDDEVASVRRAGQRRDAAQIAESIRSRQRRGLTDPALDPDVVANALGALTLHFDEAWLVEGTVSCSLDEAADQISRLVANILAPLRAASARSEDGRPR